MRKRLLVLAAAFAAVPALLPAALATSQPPADQLKTVVEKATAYLKQAQNPDGSWSKAPANTGVTGIVVTGLIGTGIKPTEAPVAKGIAFIESLVNKKEGHIAGADDKATLVNYKTSINVMALNAAGKEDKYKAVIGNAVNYLKGVQWDESRGKKMDSDYYGGAGYAGDKSRPDLSNTAFFLEALKEAGVSKDDPAFKKALVFVGRCQNFDSEFNKAPWAAKNNDGSFVYTGANGGENRRTDGDGTKTDMGGYGSMTYAGIKSMIYAGVGKDDPRMKKALEWIAKNYTLDANPGMPEQNSQRGLYYYYHTFAKAMHALGEDTFTDAKGVKHDWRADLIAALAKRQKPDGSWVNETDRWMEGDPNLVTGYALMALSYCKKPEVDKPTAAMLGCKNLAMAIESFQSHPKNPNREWPSEVDHLLKPPFGGPSLLRNGKDGLIDPWGKPYNVEPRYRKDGTPYMLVTTTAPDGKPISQFGIEKAAEPKI